MSQTALPTFADVLHAAARLKGRTNITPVLSSVKLDGFVGAGTAYVKCENLQKSGSFKARGAFNAQLSIPEEKRSGGVITFSSGFKSNPNPNPNPKPNP